MRSYAGVRKGRSRTAVKHIEEETQVLVVGGGTAGVIAAIQAGRAGAQSTLVEYTGQLGGAISNGGVEHAFYFWSRHRQIIAGIGWELVTRTRELCGESLPPYQTPHPTRPSYGTNINGALYPAVAEEQALAAGVKLHYHEFVTSARSDKDQWIVETVGRGVRRTIRCRELIDCTGGADVVGILGFDRYRGEENNPEDRQPGTLIFRFGGYDVSTLDAKVVQARYEQAIATGELLTGDNWIKDRPFIHFLGGGGVNTQHVRNADDSTSELQSDANIRGRAALLRLARFIRTLPGCENARLQYAEPDVAIRETYRIVGETTIRYEDYKTGRVFADAVANTLYFIDVHTDHGVIHEFLPDHVIPTLPLSAMVPKGSRHLLAAGRCISSDRRANSALRVEASCMAMGQGAGAAAMGVKMGVARCSHRRAPRAAASARGDAARGSLTGV